MSTIWTLMPEFTIVPSISEILRKQDGWVLSGIGRHNCCSSYNLFIRMISDASRSTSWINLGIAGSGKGHYGDLCLVNKISNNGAYQILTQQLCQKLVSTKWIYLLLTIPLDRLYTLHELIDMEGSAFYDITNKLSGREFICLMKVISDGPTHEQYRRLK